MTSAAADRENRALEAASESLLGKKSMKIVQIFNQAMSD